MIGWKPKLCLNVGAAFSFSLWQTTTEASMSTTSPGSVWPAARAGPNAAPVSSARWAHTTSRAAARAAPTPASCVLSSRSNSRQHVESEATAPNTAA